MKYKVDKYGIVKLIGEQEIIIMAKENKGFGFIGKLTYDLSAKLDEFVNNHVAVSCKLETAIEPIED